MYKLSVKPSFSPLKFQNPLEISRKEYLKRLNSIVLSNSFINRCSYCDEIYCIYKLMVSVFTEALEYRVKLP